MKGSPGAYMMSRYRVSRLTSADLDNKGEDDDLVIPAGYLRLFGRLRVNQRDRGGLHTRGPLNRFTKDILFGGPSSGTVIRVATNH